jgi:hypothetical protein
MAMLNNQRVTPFSSWVNPLFLWEITMNIVVYWDLMGYLMGYFMEI